MALVFRTSARSARTVPKIVAYFVFNLVSDLTQLTKKFVSACMALNFSARNSQMRKLSLITQLSKHMIVSRSEDYLSINSIFSCAYVWDFGNTAACYLLFNNC